MSYLDGICHEKHAPINIDSRTRERLGKYLLEKAPRGQGYTALIEEALDRVGADRNDERGFPLPRPAGFIPTEEQSAIIKAFIDTAEVEDLIAVERDYPLEADEWVEEFQRGDRKPAPFKGFMQKLR